MDGFAKLSELKTLLANVQENGSGFTCRCPSHEDKQNSLSISAATDGTILLKCHAGCGFKEIVSAIGKPMSWFFPGKSSAGKSSRGTLTATYDYRDVDGTLLYQACRFEMPSSDGKPGKRFTQRKPDGNGGWEYKLNGVQKVPYRLPELLAADVSLPVLIVEGEKHVDQLRKLGFIATCNVGGAGKWLKSFSDCLRGRDVIILPDNDSPGRKHAIKVADALRDAANSVNVLILPGLPEKGDVLDWLTAGGTGDQLRELLAGTKPVEEAFPVAEQDSPDGDSRVRIKVTADEHVVIQETLDALATDPTIYKRTGQLVHIVRERDDTEDEGIERSAGTPRIHNVSPGYLRERLSATCYFFKEKETESAIVEQQCGPPAFAVNSIHTRGFWDQLRRLSGITEIPVLRPDGSILDCPGWDQATGLLYDPGDDIPVIPSKPSRADALAARDLLLDVVCDFPFAADTHRSSWLAGLLTVLARRAFNGPAPMFLLDANIRGSGKSLLADVIGIIATSRPMPRFSNPGDDDECRKRILSIALAGDPMVLIDNISSTLGSASLDAALTGTSVRDRLLGTNDVVQAPLKAIWFASGNNIILRADTSRRVCHARLDSPEENPEERTGFRHANLKAYVRERRTELVAAGLTILRAFVVAGKPDAGLKPWGSFEDWSDLIRNALVWVDMPDPGETRQELAESADRDAAALRALFDGWSEIDPAGNGLTAAEIVKTLGENRHKFNSVRDAFCELCGVSELIAKDSRKVGNQLRRFKGRVIGDKRLELKPDRARTNRWLVTCHGVSGESGESLSDPLAREVPVFSNKEKTAETVVGGWETHTPDSPDTPSGSGVCERCGFDCKPDKTHCDVCNDIVQAVG